jgi:hypothetical protein
VRRNVARKSTGVVISGKKIQFQLLLSFFK